MGDIISTVIAGAIIGALARLVLSGDQHMPWWQHLLVGIVGVVAGYQLVGLIGWESTIIRWIISVALAAGAILLLDRVLGGSSGSRA